MNIKKCWICGNIADSKEHKIKSADIKRTFGKEFKREKSCVLVDSSGKIEPVQGPNSKKLKYPHLICEYCNNTFTQPFDRAYDEFKDYFFKNKKQILYRRFINFEDIYGSNYEEKQINLFRYFAKSFGCRIAMFGDNVPKDINEVLLEDSFRTSLKVAFSINEDKLLFKINLIGNGVLYLSSYKYEKGYSYSEYNDCLTITINYLNAIDGSLGSTWVADNKFIYLGSFNSSLPDEERKKLSD